MRKMKSVSKIVSDDEEDRDSGLQIRSETEADACILQLRKIAAAAEPSLTQASLEFRAVTTPAVPLRRQLLHPTVERAFA